MLVPPAYGAGAPPPLPPVPAQAKGALEHARERVSLLYKALDGRAEDLELGKAMDKAIATLGRLEHLEEVKVARILRSPEWRRIEAAFTEALKPFGAAPLRAVHEALAELEATEEPARSAAA